MEMSFKDSARAELLEVLPQKNDEVMSFLSGLARTCGSVEISNRHINLCFWLQSYEEGLRVVDLLKQLYPTNFELSLDKNKQGGEACKIQVPSGISKQAMSDLGIMSIQADEYDCFVEGIAYELTKSIPCKVAYLKGLFLGSGSIWVPSMTANGTMREGYHFELQLNDELFANDVMELMSDLRINTRMSERGEHKLVYIKDKDEIVKLLATIGLNECTLKLQSIIDERETANSINRSVICETANFDKTLTASAKQLLAIAELKSKDLFDGLSEQLKQTADARAQHSDASLNELAEILGISKSCLNHRLRKLVELAALQ